MPFRLRSLARCQISPIIFSATAHPLDLPLALQYPTFKTIKHCSVFKKLVLVGKLKRSFPGYWGSKYMHLLKNHSLLEIASRLQAYVPKRAEVILPLSSSMASSVWSGILHRTLHCSHKEYLAAQTDELLSIAFIN